VENKSVELKIAAINGWVINLSQGLEASRSQSCGFHLTVSHSHALGPIARTSLKSCFHTFPMIPFRWRWHQWLLWLWVTFSLDPVTVTSPSPSYRR
jgi:hypothetical protein